MNNNQSFEQILYMTLFGIYDRNNLWEMYQENILSLEEYCQCITELSKKNNEVI